MDEAMTRTLCSFAVTKTKSKRKKPSSIDTRIQSVNFSIETGGQVCQREEQQLEADRHLNAARSCWLRL